MAHTAPNTEVMNSTLETLSVSRRHKKDACVVGIVYSQDVVWCQLIGCLKSMDEVRLVPC